MHWPSPWRGRHSASMPIALRPMRPGSHPQGHANGSAIGAELQTSDRAEIPNLGTVPRHRRYQSSASSSAIDRSAPAEDTHNFTDQYFGSSTKRRHASSEAGSLLSLP